MQRWALSASSWLNTEELGILRSRRARTSTSTSNRNSFDSTRYVAIHGKGTSGAPRYFGSRTLVADLRPCTIESELVTRFASVRPRNHFALTWARTSLLPAGGIGITPILAMAHALHMAGADFEHHYCARSAGRMAFRDEILRSGFASRVHLHPDDGEAIQRLDAERVLGLPGDRVHLYVCGPSGFMSHVLGAAKRLGWPEIQCHREHFAAPASEQTGDNPFEIVLARTGSRYVVPVARSAVEVLRGAGVQVPTSCEAGVCGTCITRVVDGTPDHRDAFPAEAERVSNQAFAPCCSRSRTPILVLDL